MPQSEAIKTFHPIRGAPGIKNRPSTPPPKQGERDNLTTVFSQSLGRERERERAREREREREKERERERERENFYSVLDRDVQTIFVLLPYLFQTFMTNSVPLASNKANFD